MDVVVRIFGLGLAYQWDIWNVFDIFVVLGTFSTTTAILLGSQNSTVYQIQELFLICIAFKLVQKLNILNQLFKIAMCVYFLRLLTI